MKETKFDFHMDFTIVLYQYQCVLRSIECVMGITNILARADLSTGLLKWAQQLGDTVWWMANIESANAQRELMRKG